MLFLVTIPAKGYQLIKVFGLMADDWLSVLVIIGQMVNLQRVGLAAELAAVAVAQAYTAAHLPPLR